MLVTRTLSSKRCATDKGWGGVAGSGRRPRGPSTRRRCVASGSLRRRAVCRRVRRREPCCAVSNERLSPEDPRPIPVPTGSGPWRAYLTIVLVNLAALGLITFDLRDPTRGALRLELPPTIRTPATAPPPPQPTTVRLVVHVAGAVRRPGVVALTEGARVADAVTAAGGLAEGADQARINLAAPVADGAMLWVPTIGEENTGSLPASPGPQSGLSAAAPSDGLQSSINVNTATAADLESLPGIGPSLAERIISYRDTQGPFSVAEDLLAVPGIGPRTLERFVDRVRVR